MGDILIWIFKKSDGKAWTHIDLAQDTDRWGGELVTGVINLRVP
jgi:hypothetical protein